MYYVILSSQQVHKGSRAGIIIYVLPSVDLSGCIIPELKPRTTESCSKALPSKK